MPSRPTTTAHEVTGASMRVRLPPGKVLFEVRKVQSVAPPFLVFSTCLGRPRRTLRVVIVNFPFVQPFATIGKLAGVVLRLHGR